MTLAGGAAEGVLVTFAPGFYRLVPTDLEADPAAFRAALEAAPIVGSLADAGDYSVSPLIKFPWCFPCDSMSLRQIWGSRMSKPHPIELCEHAVRLVEQGGTHTEVARRLCVSIKFVNDMVRLKRQTGSLAPKAQGNPGRGKLTGVKGWVERRIAARPDLTSYDLTAELAAEHGVKVHRSSVGRLLLRLGLSHKKDLQALEQKRPDVADLLCIWIGKRQPFMARHLERLAFIDETSLKTTMAKITGWAPRGQRLVDHAPLGHWRTQTFIGALRPDRIDAPWVIDRALNDEMFDLYVKIHLVPTLRPGDVVILDNL